MNNNVYRFLSNKNMLPESIKPDEISDVFLDHMHEALDGRIIDVPMLRTNITTDGSIEDDKNVIVIDAGGTNYRCGLASFSNGRCNISNYKECKIPGAVHPVSWHEFISFLVDTIEPFANQAESIGFCFSYSAEITANCDGIVKTIDKEIQITECEGMLIGESINKELVKRGYEQKRVVILNDTVAALLGTYFSLDKSLYSSFSGMICGTGFNICTSYKSMIFNVEAGAFTDMPQGIIDKELDKQSAFPGEKTIEKMVSGVYIGPVCRELIIAAGEEGLISEKTSDKIKNVNGFNGAYVSAFSVGNNYESLCEADDVEFVKGICEAMLHRSARCVSSAIIAILKLNKTESDKPACICSEGSLIAKSDVFKKYLFSTLDEYAVSKLNLKYEIIIGKDTTLPGSAAAVLLND